MDKSVYSIDLNYEDAIINFFEFKTCEDGGVGLWHKHIFYELHFALGKNFTYKFKDREIHLRPGEFLIIPPSMVHESVEYSPSSLDYKVLSIEIKKNGEGVFYDCFTNGLNDISMRPLKMSNVQKDVLITFGRKDLYGSVLGVCELKMCASQMVYMLMKKSSQNRCVKSDANKSKVLIDSLILKPGISLGEIAEAVNYSKRQLSRLIKEQYGETFSNIQKRIRENE